MSGRQNPIDESDLMYSLESKLRRILETDSDNIEAIVEVEREIDELRKYINEYNNNG